MTTVAVIGLGYVGLPLAIALAERRAVIGFDIIGFDIDPARVAALKAGRDRTGEVTPERLQASALTITADPAALAGCAVYIVAVPTPVDAENRPDLSALLAACRTVGRAMGRGAIVVFESTVSPGVTEDVCGPVLAASSGLTSGVDFFLGYSPERINPGDREHTVDRITKVIAGQTPEVVEQLAVLYGAVTTGGVFRAASIRVAEAAKVIENAQRDINIAFINEVTMIFQRQGLSVHDVLDAARTKWNFLPFEPGLVGGHCIGVDPFYLAQCARDHGLNPEVILAGRRINDGMGAYVAARVLERLDRESPQDRPQDEPRDRPQNSPPRILMLGLTFKENVPDLRNSKAVDIIHALRAAGCQVQTYDPFADPDEARQLYGEALIPCLEDIQGCDAVVAAVAHAPFRAPPFPALLERLVRPNGLIADLKGLWRRAAPFAQRRYWTL